mmetsp:Transcript_2788/g.9000  ORF Transcript_2788/g.9000 Transcript_2788/m.9000 type:complete len:200 (+) Transcript_2788:3548-4147(+)
MRSNLHNHHAPVVGEQCGSHSSCSRAVRAGSVRTPSQLSLVCRRQHGHVRCRLSPCLVDLPRKLLVYQVAKGGSGLSLCRRNGRVGMTAAGRDCLLHLAFVDRRGRRLVRLPPSNLRERRTPRPNLGETSGRCRPAHGCCQPAGYPAPGWARRGRAGQRRQGILLLVPVASSTAARSRKSLDQLYRTAAAATSPCLARP